MVHLPQNTPVRTPTDTTNPKPPAQETPGPSNKKSGPYNNDDLANAAAKRPASGDVQAATGRMRFEELPPKLQDTLRESFAHPDQFWARLGNTQRQTLATTFNRLDSMGLWKHVTKVTGEKEQPEAPVGGKVNLRNPKRVRPALEVNSLRAGLPPGAGWKACPTR